MTDADLAREHERSRRDPAAAAYWAWIGRPFRIALASSPEYAPLYLALDGERVSWVSDIALAEPFPSRGQAQAFADDELQSEVRICR